MRISALAKKRKIVREAHDRETQAFRHVLQNLMNPVICKFFMDAYKNMFPSATNVEQCRLFWDGLLLTLQNVRKEQVLFIYGPNGIHEPQFCYWDKTKRHSRYPVFRFWETLEYDEDEDRPSINFPRDVLICIYRHLRMRDLLECRLVNKQWLRVANMDCVWRRYAGTFEYSLKAACLTTEPASVILKYPAMLEFVGQAWVHRYQKRPSSVFLEQSDKFEKYVHVKSVEHTVTKRALLALSFDKNGHYIAWISPKKELYVSCFTNVQGCTKNIEFIREMMLDFIN